VRLGILLRQIMERELKKNFKDTDTFFILRFLKVTASDLNILRENLKKIDSKFFVTRNVLLKRIFCSKDLTKDLVSYICGNTAVVFGKDVLVSSKILADFMKDHPDIEFRAGVLGKRILDLNDFKILSTLPSLESLKVKVLLQMKSPLVSLGNIMNGILNKFILVLKATKKQC